MDERSNRDVTFRSEQATKARKLIRDLNSVARKVADAILDAFPEAEVTRETSHYDGDSGFDNAKASALRKLSNRDRRREFAVDIGVRRARGALVKAYEEMRGA